MDFYIYNSGIGTGKENVSVGIRSKLSLDHFRSRDEILGFVSNIDGTKEVGSTELSLTKEEAKELTGSMLHGVNDDMVMIINRDGRLGVVCDDEFVAVDGSRVTTFIEKSLFETK